MHPRGLPEPLAGVRRTLVMSVLNVTPDSFSDGGRFVDVDVAVDHALEQVAAGADIVDVGGESTRPGARRIPADEELRPGDPGDRATRGPRGRGQHRHDARRGRRARRSRRAPAWSTTSPAGWPIPAMHAARRRRGRPLHRHALAGALRPTWTRLARYDDVVADVRAELGERLAALDAAGVDPARVVLDPGLGFAKTPAHNWALLAALPELVALGHPVLIGASRKRFLGELLGEPGAPRPVEAARRAPPTPSPPWPPRPGRWAVRVHDVRGSRDAIAVAGRVARRPGAPAGSTPRLRWTRSGRHDPPSADQGARMTDAFSRDLDRITLTGVRARGYPRCVRRRAPGRPGVPRRCGPGRAVDLQGGPVRRPAAHRRLRRGGRGDRRGHRGPAREPDRDAGRGASPTGAWRSTTCGR